MGPGQLIFSAIREDRDWYFVEYKPPYTGSNHAVLTLTVLRHATAEAVASAMESEALIWLKRYPIPIWTTAFDSNTQPYNFRDMRAGDSLIGYLSSERQSATLHWGSLDGGIPGENLTNNMLLHLYRDIPHTSEVEREHRSQILGRQVRRSLAFYSFWAVFPALAWAIAQYVGPGWIGGIALAITCYKLCERFFSLRGQWPKSRAAREAESERILMEHHHYHCMRNPEAFGHLKQENFDRDAAEEIQREVEALRA